MTAVGAMAFEVETSEDAASGIDALYRAEARTLIGMLTAYVGDRALAEDLAQEAFVRVQRSWDRIRERDRLVSYLRATAFNLARSSLRRRMRPVPPVEVSPIGPAPEEGVLLSEDQQAVIDAVQRLPRQQRACVILRYYSELGIDDIAATLGISPNSVKTHLVRALDALEISLGSER
jgi:RNA polymerase sigma-70 factor (sigma-E family)